MLGYVLFATLSSTALCGWLVDQCVPYFPIELSRTATGQYSRWIFSIGLILSCLLLLKEYEHTPSIFVIITGVLALIWFNDQVENNNYTKGVSVTFFAIGNIVTSNDTGVIVYFYAIFVFLLYSCAKVLVVYTYELGPSRDLLDWDSTFDQINLILQTGKVTNELSLIVFKIAGVMHWLCFWIIYQAWLVSIKSI